MPRLPPDTVQPADRKAWRAWLMAHHTRNEGVWLALFKKATGKQTYTFDEAVEEAICFGWIDSVPRKLDDERSLLYFAPRKPGSGWSRLNKERVERMRLAGLMTPAGEAKISAAQADGSWSALDAVENLEVPEDLREALKGFKAEAYFGAFPRSVKRGILEWIASAKRLQTRAERVEETARLAAENRRANQWPRE